MNQILYREPVRDDAQSLILLMKQLGYPIEAGEMENNIHFYASLKNQKAWVALEDDNIIGCIAVALTSYFHRKGSFLRIIALVVDEKNRRKGVGKRLIRIAEDYASEQQCSHIELTSGVHRAAFGSHSFYESLGYVELGDHKKYFGKKLD